MVKLLFFRFRVTNSMVVLLFFQFLSYECEVHKWKKFLKYYGLNAREPLKIDITP